MKEKRQVNRFKDKKAILRECEEANKKEGPRKFSRRKKSYVVVIAVCLLLLALKYLVF